MRLTGSGASPGRYFIPLGLGLIALVLAWLCFEGSASGPRFQDPVTSPSTGSEVVPRRTGIHGFEDVSRRVSAAAREEASPTTFHVRVKHPYGPTLKEGLLRLTVVAPASELLESVAIEGSLTRLSWPSGASAIALEAGAAGFDYSERLVLTEDRVSEADAENPITIIVGNLDDAAYISGRIFVNGVNRIPSGIVVKVVETEEQGLINELLSSYVVLNPPRGACSLWVTSHETSAARIDVSAASWGPREGVALQLAGGRTLRLEVLSLRSDEPVADLEITGLTRVVSERGFGAITYRSQSVAKRTDDRGQCEFKNLPIVGDLVVATGLEESAVLLTRNLTENDPLEFREIVYIDDTPGFAKTGLWGTLALVEWKDCLDDVRIRARSCVERPDSTGSISPVGPDGAWSLSVDHFGQWQVWAEVHGHPASNEINVEITEAQPKIGPLHLVRQVLPPVGLRFVNVPGAGQVRLIVQDASGLPHEHAVFAVDGNEFTRELDVAGEATLVAQYEPLDSGKTGMTCVHTISPQSSEVTVDLHGDQLCTIMLAVDGAPPVSQGRMNLYPIEGGSDVIVHVEMVEGRSLGRVPVPEGKYVYYYVDGESRGLLCGIVEVDIGVGIVEADLTSVDVARSDLGTGIELISVDGISVHSLAPELRRITWPDSWAMEDGTHYRLPATAKYVVIEDR